MDEEKIKHYIIESRKHGLSDEHIRINLLSVGWEPKVVDSAFAQNPFSQTNKQQAYQQPQVQPSYQAQQQYKASIQPQAQASAQQRPLMQRVDTSSDPSKLLRSDPVVPPNAITAKPATNSILEIQQQAPPQFQKKSPLKMIIVAAIIIIILAAASYGIFAYATNSPEKVWNSFLLQLFSSQNNGPQHSNSEIKFSDASGSTPLSADLKSVTDSDLSHPENLLTDSSISAQFTMAAQTYGIKDIELRLIGKILYVNIGSIPAIANYAANYGGWVKIDTTSLPQQYKDILNSELQKQSALNSDEIKKLLNDSQVISSHKYIGKETLSSTDTYHYQFVINKEAFKKFVANNLPKVDSALPDALQVKYNLDFFNALVDKVNIVQSDIWIGINDKAVHKLVFEIKFPSLASDVIGAADQNSRDAKRIADAKQMMTALGLYYNNFSKYPPAVNGFPDGLVPTYVGQNPHAPTPADGSCSTVDNLYTYKQVDGGKSYALDFCLGKDANGFTAGKHTASPQGISGQSSSNISVSGAFSGINVQQLLSGPQTADLLINYDSTNLKTPLNLQAPPTSLDLLKELSSTDNNISGTAGNSSTTPSAGTSSQAPMPLPSR